jgi:DNA-3-methyladenine glycosylase I
MRDYHDREWGVPVHDDRLLFEFLVLEGAQAGLSWMTILRKRDAYRTAFKRFEPATVARFTDASVARLMGLSGIVRNRRKIESAIKNARVVLSIAREHGSFDRYLWTFIGGRPQRNAWTTIGDTPAETAASRELSRDLTKRELRRADDLLRIHAGNRTGQRSPGQLLPLPAALSSISTRFCRDAVDVDAAHRRPPPRAVGAGGISPAAECTLPRGTPGDARFRAAPRSRSHS